MTFPPLFHPHIHRLCRQDEDDAGETDVPEERSGEVTLNESEEELHPVFFFEGDVRVGR